MYFCVSSILLIFCCWVAYRPLMIVVNLIFYYISCWLILQIVLIQYNCVYNLASPLLQCESSSSAEKGMFLDYEYLWGQYNVVHVVREKRLSCYVIVCTFSPCMCTQSKCHVFTCSHMLIDYQTGLKWCGVNPHATTHKYIHRNTHKCTHTVFRKDFLNAADGSEFSCVE